VLKDPQNVRSIGRCALLLASIAASLGAASLAAAASDCTLAKVAELPVRFAHGKLVTDGAINGQKIGVMIDTGATRTMLLRAAAESLGLGRQKAGQRYRMLGIGGETNVEVASLDEFTIGQATRKGWRIMVAGEHDFGDGVAVILGEDFLDQTDVEFDIAHNAVRLFQPKGCENTSLAYWATDSASVVNIDPISDALPTIVLTVQINGKPVRAMLDSGAGASVLDRSQAARLGVTPQTAGVVAMGRGVGLGEKAEEYWTGPFESFAIGNEVIQDTTILFGDLWKHATFAATGSRISRSSPVEEAMLLGADFLRAHRLLIAHSQQKIYFTYAGGPVFQRMPAPQGRTDPKSSQATGAACSRDADCEGAQECRSEHCVAPN
jgi:clan AA aspartic protease (TIGR02281 family)